MHLLREAGCKWIVQACILISDQWQSL